MFWNDLVPLTNDPSFSKAESNVPSAVPESEWTMKGRQRACRYDVGDDEVKEMIDVPPVSILNAIDFATVDAEISMIDQETRLMRYSCCCCCKSKQNE